MILFNIKDRAKFKPLINVRALRDITTGNYITGQKGEKILNGGLGALTVYCGPGNNFKSTIMHKDMLTAADIIKASTPTQMLTNDTEINISYEGLVRFTKGYNYLGSNVLAMEDGCWIITDKTQYSGDRFDEMLKQFVKDRQKDKKSQINYECFKNPIKEEETFKDYSPVFCEIDSLSKFESKKTMEMVDKSSLDDSVVNTLAMAQGKFKSNFLDNLPRYTANSGLRFLVSIHIGEKIDMSGMYEAKPTKNLQHMGGADVLKGVPNNISYLASSFWFLHSAKTLIHRESKGPLYPSHYAGGAEDLNVVKMKQIRCKSGSSGYTLEIIVSQSEGLLAELTEYHYIKTNGYYGLIGSNQSHNLAFLPDIKLSRTTVRKKIDEDKTKDKKLSRAIKITADMLQIQKFQPSIMILNIMCTPEELYNDLIKMGYDWDELLTTRDWWTPDNYNKNLPPYCSTLDLLEFRAGYKKPYWFTKEQKEKITVLND